MEALYSLTADDMQDNLMVSPNETEYVHTRDYVKLVGENWKNISKIPVERQEIPVLMRCVKNMLNIPDETVHVYSDEEINTHATQIYNFHRDLLAIMRGMEGMRYSS